MEAFRLGADLGDVVPGKGAAPRMNTLESRIRAKTRCVLGSLSVLVLACQPTTPVPQLGPPSAQSPPVSPAGLAPAEAPWVWQSKLHLDHPLVGSLFDAATGDVMSEAALLARVAQSEVLILGEQHDNPDHHRVQARIIADLDERGRRLPVVFEQLYVQQQEPIDVHLRAHPNDADVLAHILQWDQSGWPDWEIYRPVFEAALKHGAGVIAGSLGRATTRAVSKQGLSALEPELVQQFELTQALPPELAADLRQAMHDAHCGMLPEAMLEPMALVQRARDAALASAVHGAGSSGAVLITGNGHARRDRGVPAYLQRAFATSVVSVAILEVRPGKNALSDYLDQGGAQSAPFDYVWFTPVVSEEDHCEKLRRRFGKPTSGFVPGEPTAVGRLARHRAAGRPPAGSDS